MTEVIVFFACLGIAFVFCRVLGQLPGDVAKDLGIDGVDSDEPPNLREPDLCISCKHAHDTDWGDGMHCRKFDEWILIYEVCDGYERDK